MDTVRDVNLPAQGLRSPRSRRSGGTVPAPCSSSSHDGLPTACTAGAVGEHTSAKTCGESTGGTNLPNKEDLHKVVRTPLVSIARIDGGSGNRSNSHSNKSKDGKEEMEGHSTDSTQVSMEVSSQESSILALNSDGADLPSETNRKRKRGRPPKKTAGQTQEPALLNQTGCGLSRSERKAEESLEELLEEYKNAPTPDLGAIIYEEMARVWQVSKVSRGLKGELSGALKRASCRTRAAVQAILGRKHPRIERDKEEWPLLPTPYNQRGNELSRLRDELSDAKRQIESLQNELRKLNEAQGPQTADRPPHMESGQTVGRGNSSSPTSPLQHPKAKRAKREVAAGRRRLLRSDSSSSSEEEDTRGRGTSADSCALHFQPQKSSTIPLPPREEWPPALRPPIKGRRKDLSPKRDPRVGGVPEMPEESMEVRIMTRLTSMFKKWTESMARSEGGKENPSNNKGNKKGAVQPLPSNPPKQAQQRTKGKKKKGGNASEQTNEVGPTPPSKTKQNRAEKQLATNSNVSAPAKRGSTTYSAADQTPWTEVVGRKSRRNGGTNRERLDPRQQNTESALNKKGPKREGNKKATPLNNTAGGKFAKTTGQKKNRRKGPPRNAAVVLTCPEGHYAECIRSARERIKLADLGIEAIKLRRALTGALILEVPGPDSEDKANKLAALMSEVLTGREGIRVTRPTKTAELRLKGLDESISKAEIQNAVAQAGQCQGDDVNLGEIVRAAGGMYSVRVKCPLAAANKITGLGHLKIGWSKTKVEALEGRPLQCFKCLHKGHVRAQCPYEEDRSGLCYRCGKDGHKAKDCPNPPSCILCKAAGRQSGHRMGGLACKATPPKKTKNKGSGPPNTTAAKPVGTYTGPPAPPPCSLEGPKQPPQWDYVVPPLPCAKLGSEEEPKEQRPPGPRIVAMEVVAPPGECSSTERKGGLEEPMELEATNGH